MTKRPVARDAKGRFEKGSSGNRLGRPVRAKSKRTPSDIRQDFLDLASSPITITEGGRRRRVSISHAIDLQQVKHALNGSRLAAHQFKQREERYASEAVAEALDLLEQLLRQQKFVRDFPEEVTDRHLELIRQAHIRLKGFGLDQ